MYTEFYGLRDQPFLLTPDPRFFFESSVHRRAEAHLMYGLNQGEGFIVITGDVGAGKTTLVGHLLSTLDNQHYVTARMVSTQLDADDTLRMVASAFGVPFENMDKASLLRRLEQFLVSNLRRGLRNVLLVDEVQNMSVQGLEELRMLSNFQVGRQVPLQAFLLGQPQFRRILASRDMEQLRQRVIASYHLGPMNAQETAEYIRHRMRLAGWADNPTFSDDSFLEVFRHTRGVPRRINTLCSRLLLFGALERLHHLDGGTVVQVAEDLRRESQQVLEGPEESMAVAQPPPPPPPPLSARPAGTGGAEQHADHADLAELSSIEVAMPPSSPPPMPMAQPGMVDLERRLAAAEARLRHHDRTLRRVLHLAAENFGGGDA